MQAAKATGKQSRSASSALAQPLSRRPGRRAERLRARLHHGPLSRQVIELAATGQLGMAAAGQIRLAVVTRVGHHR